MCDETFSFMGNVFGRLVHWGAEYIVGASYNKKPVALIFDMRWNS